MQEIHSMSNTIKCQGRTKAGRENGRVQGLQLQTRELGKLPLRRGLLNSDLKEAVVGAKLVMGS